MDSPSAKLPSKEQWTPKTKYSKPASAKLRPNPNPKNQQNPDREGGAPLLALFRGPYDETFAVYLSSLC